MLVITNPETQEEQEWPGGLLGIWENKGSVWEWNF